MTARSLVVSRAHFVCGMALLLLAPSVLAQKTIVVNFNSTEAYTESDGVMGTATASGLTADQITAVIAVAQNEYTTAKLNVTIMSGASGGDVYMIVTGSQAPGANKGKEYGDMGKPGKAGLVHGGEFTTDGFTGMGLTNAIGETLAHEAAHKLGRSGHNETKPPTKMTAGGLVSIAQRKADNRQFDATDISQMKTNGGVTNAEQKDSTALNELGILVGTASGPNTKFIGDDLVLETQAIYTGPSGSTFGYISSDGEYIFVGSEQSNPTWLSFFYTNSENLAVYDSGTLYTISGAGTISLNNPNPANTSVYTNANLQFEDGASLSLTLISGSLGVTTGGFSCVPSSTNCSSASSSAQVQHLGQSQADGKLGRH
jgi:hypothetical protein